MKGLVLGFVSAFLLFSNSALSGDVDAGEARYAQNCGNCHGPAGMGLASYPKLKGKDISYLTDRLQTYRAGKKIGPNSSLSIPPLNSLIPRGGVKRSLFPVITIRGQK